MAPGPQCATSSAECTLDRAVRFNGTQDGYLTAKAADLIDTAGAHGFGVAAWVRLTDATGDRVAVSLDGPGLPGFVLGFDGASKKWVFATPAEAVPGSGRSVSVSTSAAVPGKWTHLAGTYDPVKDTIQLYVNGVAQPAVAKQNSWRATGAVQLGRRASGAGYDAAWEGELADVKLFDRLVVAGEAKDLAKQRAQRLAYWPLDEQVGTKTQAYDEDGPELDLAGGATVRAVDPETSPPGQGPMVGSGDLRLDGKDDYAHTAGSVAATDSSFTVSARVRLSTAACTRNMAVVSQAGIKESAFTIRCSAANDWEVLLPQLDGTDAKKPPVVLKGGATPNGDSSGQQLTLTYDAVKDQASLYVNGQLSSTATVNFSAAWAAKGAFTIGRSLRQGAHGDYFAGVIDEVRVYAGAVDSLTVQELSDPEPNPGV